MSRIKIKNFGPIKEGFTEGDGFMDVKKVTVFIGNQGSGKSTVAKVISTLTWMEKALSRGDVSRDNLLTDELYEHFEYQRIEQYFKKDTLIDYQGEFTRIVIKNEIENCKITYTDKKQLNVLPKIMYVPAERNFLTVVQDAYDVTNIPATLKTFGEEFKKSMLSINGNLLDLPIGKDKIKYDRSKDKIYLVLNELDLEISDSSSGYQSLVPLYAVTKYLCEEIEKNSGDIVFTKLTINQTLRREGELDAIKTDNTLSPKTRKELIKDIDKKYFPLCLVNVVEEPEQNLFPTSQQKILNSLLAFNNQNENNKLIMTTHSPYLINYLSIAIQGDYLLKKLKNSNKQVLINKLNDKVVPVDSVISVSNVVVYQLDEKNGTISKLPMPEGIPSDKNYLNESLRHGNQMFDKLLEIEEEL